MAFALIRVVVCSLKPQARLIAHIIQWVRISRTTCTHHPLFVISRCSLAYEPEVLRVQVQRYGIFRTCYFLALLRRGIISYMTGDSVLK